MFFVGLLVFFVSVIIQYFALNRIAFGRFIFITVAMFVVGSIIWMSPHEVSKFISGIFFVGGWAFLLFMTFQSILRARYNKKKKLTDVNS